MDKQPRSTGDILHRLNPHLKDQPIVRTTAWQHERRTGKRLGHAEAQLGAYALRLEQLLGRERTRSHTIGAMVQHMLVRSDEIPASYWQAQVTANRSNGRPFRANDYDKKLIIDNVRDAQATGARKWVEQLTDPAAGYPVWFQVHALHGVSHMGRFNPATGQYRKRSRSTTAPYPRFDAAVVDQVYQSLAVVHEQAGTVDDNVVQQLAQGGNFNKLYAHYLQQRLSPSHLPEQLATVSGEWREYNPFMIHQVIDASEGTYWCTAGTEMASYHLQDESHRFYMYHLQDPATGQVQPTAMAAIHMENGVVNDVVGQDTESQKIHTALLPIVQQKLHELPGGDYHLWTLADNQQLNEMDAKFQAGEAFSVDELLFLYEVNRPIHSFSGWEADPRITDFKAQRQLHQHQLAEVFDPDDARWMVLEPRELIDAIDDIVTDNVAIDRVIQKLYAEDIIYEYDHLIRLGATIDSDSVAAQLGEKGLMDHLEWVLAYTSSQYQQQHQTELTAAAGYLGQQLDYFMI